MNRTHHTNQFYFRSELANPLSVIPEARTQEGGIQTQGKMRRFRINTFGREELGEREKGEGLSLPKVGWVQKSRITRSQSMEPCSLGNSIS